LIIESGRRAGGAVQGRILVGQDQFERQSQGRNRMLVDQSGQTAEHRFVVAALQLDAFGGGFDQKMTHQFRAVVLKN
uniref:Uncharacterized protein n=1 Tax=Romanomermis culicivorax TaxID=13658 RepID=A0A915JB73_ROMCU